MRPNKLKLTWVLSALLLQTSNPVFASTISEIICKGALKRPSPEYTAGLSLAEALRLDSLNSMSSASIGRFPSLNRAILMMTNTEMETALGLLLKFTEGGAEELLTTELVSDGTGNRNINLFEELSMTTSLEFFGGQSIERQMGSYPFFTNLVPQDVIEYDFDHETEDEHLAIFFRESSVYLGPAKYKFPDPEDYVMVDGSGMEWPIQPNIPVFYRISDQRLARILKAWAFR